MGLNKTLSDGNMLEMNDKKSNNIQAPNYMAICAVTERNCCTEGDVHHSHGSPVGAEDHLDEKHSSSAEHDIFDHIQYCTQQVLRSNSADLQENDADNPDNDTGVDKFVRRTRSIEDATSLEDLCCIGVSVIHLIKDEEHCSDTPYSHGDDRYLRVDKKAMYDATNETGVRTNTNACYEFEDDELSNGVNSKDKSVHGDQSVDIFSARNADSVNECDYLGNITGLLELTDLDRCQEKNDSLTICHKPMDIFDFNDVVNQNAWKEANGAEAEYARDPATYREHFKRIEEWIDQIEIGEGMYVDELGECSNSKQVDVYEPVGAVPHDTRSSHSIDMAYNYISALHPSSSRAHLANLRLVAIPTLSAFAGLRLLNLSSNHIVKINGGALPRGLHVLVLSRNNISTVEGFKDLTRLRVLDLSYNQISRIGHGVATCSSLRELYLTGNMIGHVEGLRRLSKLKIMDLCKNNISTTKGLGQLTANQSSLGMINIEGNPVQKNIGDGQLKKFLLSILPNLAFYNKHSLRVSGSREVSDRRFQSVLSHRSDRGALLNRNSSRRRTTGTIPHKSQHQAHASRSASSLFKPSSRAISEPSWPETRESRNQQSVTAN